MNRSITNNKKRYRFSDTQVTKVTLNEVEETFGNKKTQPNAKRNGNAIVLLYRSDSIVDKSDFEIPQFILHEITKENDEFEKEKNVKEFFDL